MNSTIPRILCPLTVAVTAGAAWVKSRLRADLSHRLSGYEMSFGKACVQDGLIPCQATVRPNNSFKPTPYRGLGLCAYATLAHRLATLGAA